MNETVRLLKDRKSVRVFEDREIPEDIRNEILDCALQAPTAGNQILYTIVDVRSQEIKDQLAVTCDNQPFIAQAKMVLVFLADCRRWYDSYRLAGCECRKPGEGDLLLACADAIIAAQNCVVAAESFGIGSCYIGDILENVEVHKELLGLDDFVFPAAMLVLGYPTAQQLERMKPERFDRKYIVMEDRYRRLSDEEQVTMFRDRAEKVANFDFVNYVTKFCERKYMSDFAMEMTRSAKVYLEKFNS